MLLSNDLYDVNKSGSGNQDGSGRMLDFQPSSPGSSPDRVKSTTKKNTKNNCKKNRKTT